MTQNISLETASRLTTQYEVEGQVVQLIICISGIQLMNNGKIFLETATRLITQYEVEGQVVQLITCISGIQLMICGKNIFRN